MKLAYKLLLSVGYCGYLAACENKSVEYNAEEYNSDQQHKIEIQTDKIVGYWKSESSTGYDVEFFDSAIAGPVESDLKTGRFYRNGSIAYLFNWSATPDGTIQMNLVNTGCTRKPLTQCTSIGSARLTARGENASQSNWSIEIDNNLDGVVDENTEAHYRRRQLDVKVLTPGEHFFSDAQNFDIPVRISVSGNEIEIQMNELEEPVYLSTTLPDSESDSIRFTDDESQLVTQEQEFLIPDVGYQVLTVKRWYENVELNASANDQYSLSYDVVSELSVPESIDLSSIDTKAINGLARFTRVGELISEFAKGEALAAPARFHTFFYNLFDDSISIAGGANDIEFTDNETGRISRTDLYMDKYSEELKFTWTQEPDGHLKLLLENGDTLKIHFVNAINGGYRVLMAGDHEVWGKQYSIHDLIRDSEVVDLDSLVPGRFSFVSNDGFSTHFVEFKANGEVVFSDLQGLGGYWFIDDLGDVVSFECTDLFGVVIEIYEECYSAFETLESDPMVNFAHVRKLRFLHRNGNDLQAKYDANVWGGIFEIVDRDYMGVSWTYRWRYLGEPAQ